MLETRRKQLILLLVLLAVHSTGVAVALIALPPSALEFFGYSGYSGRFFQMQGGVFHLVMAVIYLLAALDLDKSDRLVFATITAKTIAFVFLCTYFLFVEPIVTVLLSGLGDGAMGLAVWILYKRHAARRHSDSAIE